jgi:hypothetical protein
MIVPQSREYTSASHYYYNQRLDRVDTKHVLALRCKLLVVVFWKLKRDTGLGKNFAG